MRDSDLLKKIPRVDEILAEIESIPAGKKLPYPAVLSCTRKYLDEIRRAALAEELNGIPDNKEISQKILELARKECAYSLRPVINATGIVIHTNLGRSVLSEEAAENVKRIAAGYTNLEYSLEHGERGSRHSHIEDLLVRSTGAEAAIAVNNNAAAVMLILSALCKDKEVIVSRGELVEIGGAFRVPDIMQLSGALLCEVGTTNKTKARDYEHAVTENTAALLKVHTSNFKIVGFSEEVSIYELSKIGRSVGVPVIYDLGSGMMLSGEISGAGNEPAVSTCITAGADIICFSCDKLFGGPQAGIIAGKKKYIELIKKHQLARVVRIDKLNLAALEATLRQYLDPDKAIKDIPTLNSLSMGSDLLKKRAAKLCAGLPKLPDLYTASVRLSAALAGGGSAPGEAIPSYSVEITLHKSSAGALETFLRNFDTPIICRIQKDKVLLDPRTVPDKDFKTIAQALKSFFSDK